MSIRRIWLLLGWLLVIVVVYGSLMPSPPTVMKFPEADKVEHVSAYLAMMLWFAQLYTSTRARWRLAFGFIGLGILIEYIQGWSGWRDFEYLDMVADAAGVSLGWALVWSPLGRILAWLQSR